LSLKPTSVTKTLGAIQVLQWNQMQFKPNIVREAKRQLYAQEEVQS